MRHGQAGHEAVEHTADLATRAWAPDLSGLIEQAVRGMLDLMLSERPEAREFVEIDGEGRDAEELLVDCLREILALWTIDERAPVSIDVVDLGDERVICRVGLAGQTEGRAAVEQEIKAATYHGLEVERVEHGYEVTVVFDV